MFLKLLYKLNLFIVDMTFKISHFFLPVVSQGTSKFTPFPQKASYKPGSSLGSLTLHSVNTSLLSILVTSHVSISMLAFYHELCIGPSA